MGKVMLAFWFGGMILVFPETALNAAREAMGVWANTVAPALFPFMALMPMLTSEMSIHAYERLTGGFMKRLFRLPGRVAPAVLMGMIAGAPTGLQAASRLCGGRTLERMALCCGMSPAFLMTGVGVSMLGSASDGRRLLAAQVISQLLLLFWTRWTPPEEAKPAVVFVGDGEVGPVRAAVGSVLSVCGYMVIFSIGGAMLGRLWGNGVVGLMGLCLLDVPSGAAALCGTGLPRESSLILLSGMSGFGGFCVAAQNCAVSGIRPGRYLLLKGINGMVSAGVMAAVLRLPAPGEAAAPEIFPAALLWLCVLLVPGILSGIVNVFFKKDNDRHKSMNSPENTGNTQDVVDLEERIEHIMWNMNLEKNA